MEVNFKIPWEKYGIISYLAKVMENFNVQFGKTSLQKIIYILQEVYNVEIGYPYTLYNYGPYSFDLSSDLDYIAALNAVQVSWVNTGGYSIKPDVSADDFISKSSSFIDLNKSSIDKAIDIFAKMSAKELELRATIIYFLKEYSNQNYDYVSEQIHNLKPYFSKGEIQNTIEELENLKII